MISAIRIRNFKCFEEQDLNIGAVTLFSGLNGMGKSTILQALLLLRQSHNKGLLNKTGLALNGNLVEIGQSKDALFFNAKTDEIQFDLTCTDGQTYCWSFIVSDDDNTVKPVSKLSDYGELSNSLFGSNFHYLKAERIGPRVSFQMSEFDVKQSRQIGPSGEYCAHFLSCFEHEEIPISALCHPTNDSLGLRDQVEAWLSEISPNTRIHVTPHSEMDLVSLEFSMLSGNVWSDPLRATNVGFGITYSLPVIVAILSSKPDSMVLIENPEAHLHPKGQAKMGEFFALAAQNGIQVITETHSDHVLNGIRIAAHKGLIDSKKVKTHFFARPDKQQNTRIISPVMDKNGRLDKWPDGFFDEWEKSLDALLD